MKLKPNWKRMWRAISVRAMSAAAALEVAWQTESGRAAISAVVPATWVPWITVGVLMFGIAGWAVHQPKVQP